MKSAEPILIKEYVSLDGVNHYQNWFSELDFVLQAKVDVRLDRVRLGNFGDHKSVSDGVLN